MTLRRALVADDDPTVRLLAHAALARHGFTVTAVADGGSALEEFERQAFDIVLLDVEMPVLDGYRVCTELRRRSERPLPIVLITGHDERAATVDADAAGASDVIVKPVDWCSLGARLLKLMSAQPQ